MNTRATIIPPGGIVLSGDPADVGLEFGHRVLTPMIVHCGKGSGPIAVAEMITTIAVFLLYAMHETNGAEGSAALVTALTETAAELATLRPAAAKVSH